MAHCGVYVGALGKVARDVALLMQPEVGEVAEAGGGSSAMPHKRNPSGCAIALAAATRLPGLVAAFLTGMVQEHERAAGGWQAEWDTLAAGVVETTGSALAAVVGVVEGLAVPGSRSCTTRWRASSASATSLAQQVLREARLEHERDVKAARESLPALRALLEHTTDERADLVRAALAKKAWDLNSVASTVGGDAESDEHVVLRKLRDLAGLPVLDREKLNAATTELRDANAAAQQLRGTDAGRADEVAALLQQALDVHAHAEGERCPVCGTEGVLTYQWRVQARDQVIALRAGAAEVRAARTMLATSLRQARQLVTAPLVALRDGAGAGIDIAPVVGLWDRWADVGTDDDALSLASHLETHGPPLIAAVADLRRAAAAELRATGTRLASGGRRDRPVAPAGRRAQVAEHEVGRLKEAERWMKEAHDELRDSEFGPIAGAVQANWTELRQDSNVSLGELRLLGASTQRRLSLDVKVDGEDGSALGVMSQGELNCLALSLFLPRASMPEFAVSVCRHR